MKIGLLAGILLTPILSGCGTVGHDAAQLTCTAGSVFVTEESSGKEVPFRSPTYGGDELAQSFQVTNSIKIGSFSIELMRVGSPGVSQLTASIQGDTSGYPDGITLASATLPVADMGIFGISVTQQISTAPAFYVFSFGGNGTLTLTAGRTYWLRIQADFVSSNTDTILWMANDADSYTNGKANYKDGSGNFVNTLLGTQRDFIFNLAGGC